MVQKLLLKLALMLAVLFLISCGRDSPTAANSSNDIKVIEADIKTDLEMKVNFPYEAKYSWKSYYAVSIFRYLNERSELAPILDSTINAYDLKLLKCSGYKDATTAERTRFWILFLASIAHAESGLNPNTTFREKDGSLSSGLLQVDVNSANRHSFPYTGFRFTQKDLFNADLNLMAGLYILKHQLQGGFRGERPDIRGRLFTGSSYYWSVLTLKKEMIIKTFTQNARTNLPFCSIGG